MPANSHDILARTRTGPGWYLREIDFPQDRADLVEMNEADYHGSAFLGGSRLATRGGEETQTPLNALVEAWAADAGPMHFLFHIGHCGSTLLSRILGEVPGLFSLREPRPLMSLALYRRSLGQPGFRLDKHAWHRHLQAVLALLSRTWRDSDVALVKPNSHSNNLILDELAWARGQALLLSVGLDDWLATVLKADKREELRYFGELRIGDLRTRVPQAQLPLVGETSDAEYAAVMWLIEMSELHEARENFGDRCLRVDFDELLKDPADNLARITRHLGVQVDGSTIDGVLSAIVGRHAKHDSPYDAAQRAAELTQARKRFAGEISDARRFIDTLLDQHPVLHNAGMI